MDIFSKTKLVTAIGTGNYGPGIVDGIAIDTLGYSSFLAVIIITGGQIQGITFQQTEDLDNPAWETIPDALLLATLPTGIIDPDTVVHVGCISKMRGIRIRIDFSELTTMDKAPGYLQGAYTKPFSVQESILNAGQITSPGGLVDGSSTPPKRA